MVTEHKDYVLLNPELNLNIFSFIQQPSSKDNTCIGNPKRNVLLPHAFALYVIRLFHLASPVHLGASNLDPDIVFC